MEKKPESKGGGAEVLLFCADYFDWLYLTDLILEIAEKKDSEKSRMEGVVPAQLTNKWLKLYGRVG